MCRRSWRTSRRWWRRCRRANGRGTGRCARCLRVAAARGLDYWEGADIDVLHTHEEWLASVRRSHVVTAPSPLTTSHARPLAISGSRMLVGEHFVFHELDTASFPPGAITHDGMQVTVAAFTPWGTELVRMVTDREARPFKFGYFDLPDRTPLPIEAELAAGLARPTHDGVLLFPQPTMQRRVGARPVVVRPPCTLEPLALPEAASPDRINCDAISFGDGTLLVVWDGVPYRWDGVAPPVALGGALEAPEELCAAVALSDGSIVGGFGRKLVRIDRDGERRTVLPLDNVIGVARGPDDALIISEGDNPEGDALKLWWPATREVTHVPPKLLELDDRPMFVYFDRRHSGWSRRGRGCGMRCRGASWRRCAAYPRTISSRVAQRWQPNRTSELADRG